MHDVKFASVIAAIVQIISLVSFGFGAILTDVKVSGNWFIALGIVVPLCFWSIPAIRWAGVRFGQRVFIFGKCDHPNHYRHSFAQFHNRRGWWYCQRCDRIAKGEGLPETVMPSHSVTIDDCGHQVVGLLTPGETPIFMGTEAECQNYHRSNPE